MTRFFKNRIRDPLVNRFARLHPSCHVARLINDHASHRVCSGPFKGMLHIGGSVGSQYYPKILGTYEKELHPVIERLSLKRFDNIVNVGAGEGYYAVGLAMQHPEAGVIAFEYEDSGRELMMRMAQVNGVLTRLIARGFCDIPAFSACFSRSRNCLVMMDVEGAESLLLDPHVIPELREVHILVELHDFIFRRMGDVISERFEKTHRIEEIWSEPRTLADYPFPISTMNERFFRKYLDRGISEDRPCRMRWFFLEPRS